MSCYKPLYGKYVGFNETTGKRNFKVFPARYWNNPLNDPRDVQIPCGKCIGCRLDYSRQWADRMMIELDHSKSALFLTLTYDQEHVPYGIYNESFSLNKRDVQLFLKRLRRRFDGREIRFYLAGEYGTSTFRPHYHCIVYSLTMLDFPDLVLWTKNKFNQALYMSDTLNSIWSNGNVLIGNVSWQTCAYVARYATKKLQHEGVDYASLNILPEFSLMSRRPGIAGYFYKDHPELIGSTRFFLSDPYGVSSNNEIFLPKYLLNSLDTINPELYSKIKQAHSDYASDRSILELSFTDLDELSYNDVKCSMKERAAESLIRK